MTQYENSPPLNLMPMAEVLTDRSGQSTTSNVLAIIESQHANVSTLVRNYATQKQSLLSRLFPNDLDKVLKSSQLNAARTDCELRQKLLELACTMKLEAARETADTWLKSLKVENRGQFFGFVSEKLLTLGKTIERRRLDFSVHIEERYQQVDRFSHMPAFQERYRASVDNEVDATMLWLDELLCRFRGIVQERVVQFDKSSFQ